MLLENDGEIRMKFDADQDRFPSAAHKSIWHCALFMAPFHEAAPPHLPENGQSDLREGERSLYRFMKDLYSDMYDRPELYYIPAGEYDKYMNGRERYDLHHRNDQKESSLRNRFQQPIEFYQRLLYGIGANARPAGAFELCMDRSGLEAVYGNMRLSKVRGAEERLAAALSNVGLEIKESAGRIAVSNDLYPKMLPALSALCSPGNGKYSFTNFLRCDFRGILKGFKPGFEDTTAILPQGLRAIAAKMHEFMNELGCRVSIEPLKNTVLYSKWRVDYSLRGKSVFTFSADINRLDLFAYFNHHRNISRMGYILKEEYGELYDWFYERLPGRICSCKNNNLVDIGGQKKRICGLMNRLDAGNPDSEELLKLEKVMRIYIDRVRDGNAVSGN